MLAVEELEFSYGRAVILQKVSFALAPGEIFGLLGPNGAGKTTCLRILTGQLQPKGGTVTINGRDITKSGIAERVASGLGMLPQEPSVFTRLSVRDNLLLFLEESSIKKKAALVRLDEMLERFGLSEIAKRQAGLLSGGERRRLEIARALLLSPRYMLFDEPFTAIDPLSIETLKGYIKTLAAEGIGILITDHNVRETLSVCKRACILDGGRTIAEGTPEELAANELARRRYLGENFQLA